MKYVYPAVFHQGKDAVTVYFPDLACLSQGKDYLQAFQYAREGLSFHICGMLEDEEKLPAPSRLEDIALEKNEALALIEIEISN